MFDLSALPYNSENPTVLTVLITVLFSFLLSTLLAFTYDKTTRSAGRSLHYIQTLVLISLVAASVMLAIGDSLARGLGMLGALAIIRFRTALRDPRNMAFMFASLAVGISCGVGGFIIAAVGTTGFCVVAFLLRFSPFSSANNLVGTLRYEYLPNLVDEGSVHEIIDRYCRSKTMISQKINIDSAGSHRLRNVYRVRLRREEKALEFVHVLREVAILHKVSFDLEDQNEEL